MQPRNVTPTPGPVDTYDFNKRGTLCNQQSMGATPQARPIRATDRHSVTTPRRQCRGAVVGSEASVVFDDDSADGWILDSGYV